jgi:hypothetical protein
MDCRPRPEEPASPGPSSTTPVSDDEAVIFGTSASQTVAGYYEGYCGTCHRDTVLALVRTQRRLTVFFAPVTVDSGAVAVCGTCNAGTELTGKPLAQAERALVGWAEANRLYRTVEPHPVGVLWPRVPPTITGREGEEAEAREAVLPEREPWETDEIWQAHEAWRAAPMPDTAAEFGRAVGRTGRYRPPPAAMNKTQRRAYERGYATADAGS